MKIYNNNKNTREMSKLHKKTGSTCMLCNEQSQNSIIFHKTRRQTHLTCLECGLGYLKPILRTIGNNLRKNIRNNVEELVKCPGSIHSLHRNLCRKSLKLKNITIPDCDISLDIFRINHVLSTPTVYMCPDEKCGQLVDVDIYFTLDKISCLSGCGTTWCRQCLAQPYHEMKSCVEFEAENKNTENGRFIWEMKSKGLLKFCPLCRTPTIKNSGCNKMVCSNCQVKWCWLCTAYGIDYDHYTTLENTEGVCRGKLWQGTDEVVEL